MTNFFFLNYINGKYIVTKNILNKYKFYYKLFLIIKFVFFIFLICLLKEYAVPFIILGDWIEKYSLKEPVFFQQKSNGKENNNIILTNNSIIVENKNYIDYLEDSIYIRNSKKTTKIKLKDIQEISYWNGNIKVWGIEQNLRTTKAKTFSKNKELLKNLLKLYKKPVDIEITSFIVEATDNFIKYSNEFDKKAYKIKINYRKG